MSFVKIWIHAVWGTKDRNPCLAKEARAIFFNHILENAKKKQIYISEINGYLDHVHCLISLNTDTSVAKTIQLIKGESAFWANKNQLFPSKLEWASEYFAVSVSESLVGRVRGYIRNQEEHHKKATFDQEYRLFMTKYDFENGHG